jgi:hypothetical protein
MAVNALGQTLLLSLSSQQVSDLTDGLKTGDLLRGRVVETIPDQGQAIVNLRGINVLAELLGQAQALSKGDILQVQVKALPQAGDAQSPLTLQLIDISKAAESAALPPSSLAGTSAQAASSSLASAEEALASLHIAVTRDTLAAARALQTLNQPVTPDRIASALKAAAQLLPAEANAPTDGSQALLNARSGILAQLAQGQPPLRQMQLQQADKLLLLASSGSAQEVPDSAAPLLRSAALLASSPPQEVAPLINALKQAIQALESPSEASQAPSTPISTLGLSPGGLTALDQALADMMNANPGMTLSGASQALLAQLEQPQSSLAQNLQQKAPQDSIGQAQSFLSQVAEQKPTLLMGPNSAVNAADVQASLQAQGMLTQTFATQPREQVLNSIIFLQSRQLPTTPATLEPVISTLTNGQDLAAQLQSLLEASKNAIQGNGSFSSGLKQSINQFEQSFSGLSVDPGADRVAEQLQRNLSLSGMDLESQLAKLPTAGSSNATAQAQPAARPLAQPGPTVVDLKSSLIDLQHQANLELKSPSLLADQRQQVQNISDQSRQALNQLTTLQLASQPVAGRDTASLQVPVWFGQDLVPGKLSVYWKQGKEAAPTDADPVQVVFLLSTRALKDVKVSLSLYSKDCLCRIDVSDPEVRDFLKPNLSQLKDGFSANTPYRLRTLDLALAASAPAQSALASLAPEPPAPQGLFLSA